MLGLDKSSIIWLSLRGVAMATNIKIGVFRGKKLFVALPFQNRLEYQNADGQLRSALNVATSLRL